MTVDKLETLTEISIMIVGRRDASALVAGINAGNYGTVKPMIVDILYVREGMFSIDGHNANIMELVEHLENISIDLKNKFFLLTPIETSLSHYTDLVDIVQRLNVSRQKVVKHQGCQFTLFLIVD